jgi:hypothetical protein
MSNQEAHDRLNAALDVMKSGRIDIARVMLEDLRKDLAPPEPMPDMVA